METWLLRDIQPVKNPASAIIKLVVVVAAAFLEFLLIIFSLPSVEVPIGRKKLMENIRTLIWEVFFSGVKEHGNSILELTVYLPEQIVFLITGSRSD